MLRSKFALACGTLLLLGALSAPGAKADDSPPETARGDTIDPTLIVQELLITDVQENPPFSASGATCTRSSERLTTAPTYDTNRFVWIYMTPSTADTSWKDSYLDVPMVCSDGSAHSVIDYMYRNTARFMARELYADGMGSRRLTTFTHTYTWKSGVTTRSKSLYAGYLVRTSNTYAYLSNLSPERKLALVRSRLQATGFSDPGLIYMVILHAQQNEDPSTPEDDRTTYGSAYRDQRGSGYQYGYVTRLFYISANAGYGDMRFGCTTIGDVAVLHEASHVLGAVPTTAANGDGKGHMNTTADLMGRRQTRFFNTSLELDHAGDDYRGYAYNRGYTGNADAYRTDSYRTCG